MLSWGSDDLLFAGKETMIRKVNDGNDGLRDVYVAIDAYFYDQLRNCLLRQCGGTSLESQVDDMVQEAFNQLWLALSAGRRPGITIDNWKDKPHKEWIRKTLYGSAKFTRYKLYRRGRECLTGVRLEFVYDYPVGCRVVLSEIQAALQQCTAIQRETFVLRHQGWSHGEIAEIQGGIPEATVRTNFRRARARLQKILKDYAYYSDGPQ
jgi:DNA-directed RNA polymerase specialized sigma24 family protein